MVQSIYENYLEWKIPDTNAARLEQLAQSMSSTKALTARDLVAQVKWLNEDLGYELKNGLAAPYSNVLDIIQAGAEHILKVKI